MYQWRGEVRAIARMDLWLFGDGTVFDKAEKKYTC